MNSFSIDGTDQRKLTASSREGEVSLSVWGRPDWEGYHSIETLNLSDEQVDALHEWLGRVIEERGV